MQRVGRGRAAAGGQEGDAEEREARSSACSAKGWRRGSTSQGDFKFVTAKELKALSPEPGGVHQGGGLHHADAGGVQSFDH